MSACSSDSSSSPPSRRRASVSRATSLLAAGAVLSLLAAPAGRSAQEAPAPPDADKSLMNDLSQAFRQLEARLVLADAAGVGSAAGELRALAGRLPGLTPEANTSLVEELQRHVDRFGELVDEIAGFASAEQMTDAGQAFDELRATCVSCHATFRSDNARRGCYPAIGNTVAGEVVLRDAEGKLREDRSWVLVFLEGGASGAAYHPRQKPRISQSGRRFDPRVLPVVVGAEVEFPNDDTIFHNVFSLSKTAPFDLGVYEPGESASVRMERTGLVKVYCNIHPDMAASIVVLANPWYALTGPGGRFVLCDVPDGEYVLRAWNDMGAELRRPIQVAGSQMVETRIELRETRRAVPHANKYGKPYRSSYR